MKRTSLRDIGLTALLAASVMALAARPSSADDWAVPTDGVFDPQPPEQARIIETQKDPARESWYVYRIEFAKEFALGGCAHANEKPCTSLQLQDIQDNVTDYTGSYVRLSPLHMELRLVFPSAEDASEAYLEFKAPSASSW